MIIHIVCCLFRCSCCLRIKPNIYCDNKIRCIKICVRLCVVLLWRFEAEVGCSSLSVPGAHLRSGSAETSVRFQSRVSTVCERLFVHVKWLTAAARVLKTARGVSGKLKLTATGRSGKQGSVSSDVTLYVVNVVQFKKQWYKVSVYVAASGPLWFLSLK